MWVWGRLQYREKATHTHALSHIHRHRDETYELLIFLVRNVLLVEHGTIPAMDWHYSAAAATTTTTTATTVTTTTTTTAPFAEAHIDEVNDVLRIAA